MSNNNNFAPIPLIRNGDAAEPGEIQTDDDEVALDPDVNDDLVDSAAADRLAAEGGADDAPATDDHLR